MAAAAVAALLGAFVGSATGFGFALVLSPVLFTVVEPVEAIYILLVLSLVLNVLVLFEGGLPLHVNWQRLTPLLLAALPGLAAGAALLVVLDKQTLQVAVGVAVIVAALWQLRSRARGERHSRPLSAAASLAVGFTSGMLTTSLSVSGPPLVLWLEAHGVRPAEFRATLAASFLALSIAGGAVLLVAEGTAASTSGCCRCCWSWWWPATSSGRWRSAVPTTSASSCWHWGWWCSRVWGACWPAWAWRSSSMRAVHRAFPDIDLACRLDRCEHAFV